MVDLGHEGFEVAPGAAGDQAQSVAFGGNQRECGAAGMGQADPARNGGCCQPKRRKGQHQRPDRRIERIGQGAGEEPQRHPARLLQVEAGISGHPGPAGLRSREPFQQMLPGCQPGRRARNRIQHQRRRVRQQGHHQGDLGNRNPHVARQRLKMTARRDPRMSRQDGQRQGDNLGDRQQGQHRSGPGHSLRHGQQPAGKQRKQRQRGQQRATQIVQHLPAVDCRDSADGFPLAADPRQKLPIAARPAVLSAGVHVLAAGKIFDDLDVRGKARAREGAFEQVMAEQGVVGHPAGQGRREGVDVIDAFASERPFVEQVLIDIGNGRRIGLDPAGAGGNALVERPRSAKRQGRGNLRLQNAVARGHALADRVDDRAVQGMGHLADQPAHRIAQDAGVGIQRDDELHVLRHGGAGQKAGIGRTAQQPVQFDKFAALALPPQPDALGRVPAALAVQEQKPVTVSRRIGLVQGCNRRASLDHQGRVGRRGFFVAIRPVRQKRVVHGATDAGQMMHLQPLDLVLQILRVGQQDRHRHKGAQVGWNTVFQRKSGQRPWSENPRDQEIDQRRSRLESDRRSGQNQRRTL